MSDVALVALISGSATVLVSLFGLIGTVFGPALVERMRRKAAAKDREIALKIERESRRIDRAQELSEAIMEAIGTQSWEAYAASDAAKLRFIATLRSGEGPAAKFVRGIEVRPGDGVEGAPFERKARALVDMERLFDWLRGDLSVDELVAPGNSGQTITIAS